MLCSCLAVKKNSGGKLGYPLVDDKTLTRFITSVKDHKGRQTPPDTKPNEHNPWPNWGVNKMKSYSHRQIAGTLMILLVVTVTRAAQQAKVALPRVAAMEVPYYSPLARVANVEGVVQIKITTDGRRVVATRVEDSRSKVLSAAAEQNARSWQFFTHEPTTILVTYRYKLLTEWNGDPETPTVVLRLPTEVEVSISRWPGFLHAPAELKPINGKPGQAAAYQSSGWPTFVAHGEGFEGAPPFRFGRVGKLWSAFSPSRRDPPRRVTLSWSGTSPLNPVSKSSDQPLHLQEVSP
jgi:hypothetical protein